MALDVSFSTTYLASMCPPSLGYDSRGNHDLHVLQIHPPKKHHEAYTVGKLTWRSLLYSVQPRIKSTKITISVQKLVYSPEIQSKKVAEQWNHISPQDGGDRNVSW